MSWKRYLAAMMAMMMVFSIFAVTPAEAKKKSKKNDVNTLIQAVSGCVVSGIAQGTSQDATDDSVVLVAEGETPMSSESKAVAEKKAEQEKLEKEDQEIAKQKKAAEKNYKEAVRLLACIVYCEAGCQSYAGCMAVAAVVMNRVESPYFPNTIHDVLWQPYQFGPIRHGYMARELRYYDQGMYEKPGRNFCVKVAKDILAGKYTIQYNGKTIDLKKYTDFNTHLSNAKIHIDVHDFA